MQLTQEQIARLAKLTALQPQENLEIGSVLSSFEAIQNVDVSSIATVSRSGKWSLDLREDSVVDCQLADELLACSHQKKAAHQIVLSGIMVGE